MIIIVMSTHCWTQWRWWFTNYHAVITIDYHCNEHPLLYTMEMIICFLPCSVISIYHCNEHHPEVKTIFIFYLRITVLSIAKWACYWQRQQLYCSNRYYWPLWWEPIVHNTMEWYYPEPRTMLQLASSMGGFCFQC